MPKQNPVHDFIASLSDTSVDEVESIRSSNGRPAQTRIATESESETIQRHADEAIARRAKLDERASPAAGRSHIGRMLNEIEEDLGMSPDARERAHVARDLGAIARDAMPTRATAGVPVPVSTEPAIRPELYTPAQVAELTRATDFPPSMTEADRATYREMFRTSPSTAEQYRSIFARDRLAATVIHAITEERAKDEAASIRYATPEVRRKFAMNMKQRAFGNAFANVSPLTREADFVASTDAVDSYGEIVEQKWNLERYLRNPIVLFAHDSRKLPIGRAERVEVQNGRLIARIRFAQLNPEAEAVWNAVQEGMIRAVSVGFKPRETRIERRGGEDVVVLSDNELYEISVTPLPANPEALSF